MPTATEERPAARSRRPARKADPPATSTKVQSGELPHLYEYGMVPVSKLFIDPDYQRELTPLAGQIERDFDPHMFIPLLVSARRGGKFAVFDGQHRYVGARDKGFEEVPCLIYRNLSPEQEATLFSRLQRERRGIKATDRFKAELHGDPERPETKMAIDIEKIAEQRGFTVGSTSEAEGLLKIASPTALEQTYRAKKGDMTGPEALAAALTTIKGVWPTEKRNTDSDLIRGLGLLFISTARSSTPTASSTSSVRSRRPPCSLGPTTSARGAAGAGRHTRCTASSSASTTRAAASACATSSAPRRAPQHPAVIDALW